MQVKVYFNVWWFHFFAYIKTIRSSFAIDPFWHRETRWIHIIKKLASAFVCVLMPRAVFNLAASICI